MAPRLVSVQVPASTSNLGSGFDTLGLALNLYTSLRIRRSEGTGILLRAGSSHPPETKKSPGYEMAREAADLFFRFTGGKAFGIEAWIRTSIPVARGLGFSATIRVGLLVGLNELARAGLTRDDLLQLATQLEGHPDNASPAVLGGFTVSGTVDGRVRCQRFAVSQHARFVTLIPAREVKTGLARRLLPDHYSRADAAHALNRAALITAALSGNRFSHLRGLFDDRIHQPYRERLVPGLSRIIRAGEVAGAEGGWLSGSGSSIICLATGSAAGVAKAMRREASDARVCILQADNRGFTIKRS